MADAFLHRRSIFDKHKDAYGFKNPIKQMRVARSWDNPITRRKREKSLNDWASSFAGKRHYRKLSRHNAIHLHEDNMDRVSIEEICDALNRYAIARWLPFKADLLYGADGKHISLHGGHVYLDIGYAPSGELEVYDARAVHPLNVLTHWDSVDEIAGHLLSLAVRQAAKNESAYEKLRFEKGHKDSKGNDAPWVIRSHEDDKVLASFANKDDAVQHLARMKNYSKKESVMKDWSVNVLWRSPAGFECTTRVLVRADSKEAAGREAEEYVRSEVGDVDAVAHDIKERAEGSSSLRETLRKLRTEKYLKAGESVSSESVKKNFRFKDPRSDDDLIAIQDIVYEINRRNESQAVAEKIGSELESLMESASRDPKWNEMSDEECASAMYKAAQPILSKITSEQLEEIFRNPGHDHEYFRDVIEYDEEAEEPEYRADDLYDFSSIRHESKCEWLDPEGEAVLKKQAPKLIDALSAEFKRIGSPARLELASTDVRFSDGYYLPVKCSGKWDEESRMLNARLDGKALNGVKYYDGNVYLEKGWRPTSFRGARRMSLREKPEKMGSPKHEKADEIVFEPVVNFKPQQYAVYEIDDDGDELECIFSGTLGSAKKKLGDAMGSDPNKKFHVVAIAYTPRGQLADSEVVWSDLKQELAPAANEAVSRVVADNKLGKIVKARQRDNVLAFLPIDDDGKNDDCTYFFKVDGNNIITKGYHWGRDEIDRSMIADDGYPWTAEPNRPTRDYVHTKAYAKQLVDRARKCLAAGKDTATENGASSESKDEGKFTEIKAAIKAAWSAAEAKWFRLDFQESTERLDVYPIASDNEGVGVNWGVLPGRSTIVQYATDFRTGNSEIEREMPYKDLDELEKIFVDEFKAMDETLEIGAENGADIHPLAEKSEGTDSFSHVWELQAQQAKETLEELTKRFGDADRLAFEIRNLPHAQECDVVVTIDGNPFITAEFEGGRHSGIRWHCFDDDVDDMRLDAGDENAAKNMVLHFKDDILDALEALYGFGAIADEGT